MSERVKVVFFLISVEMSLESMPPWLWNFVEEES
jgi:hypothetical protein